MLTIIAIISLFKPDLLLGKKIREKVNEEQKEILIKNQRKIYCILAATFESLALSNIEYEMAKVIGTILTIIFGVLLFVVVGPAMKESSKIMKELKN